MEYKPCIHVFAFSRPPMRSGLLPWFWRATAARDELWRCEHHLAGAYRLRPAEPAAVVPAGRPRVAPRDQLAHKRPAGGRAL